jgi:hypothetical protein
MSKNSLDFEGLEARLSSKKIYKLADVKHKLERVAFDIVRFKENDDTAALWQIQSADDGEYIVTLYDPKEEETVKTASLPWEVVLSKTAKELNLFYKGDPIGKVSLSQLGLPESELSHVERYLPKKLSENKKLVKAFLNDLGSSAKNAVLTKYPELGA